MKNIKRLETVSQAHDYMRIDKPKHPLVSVFYHEKMHSNKDLVSKFEHLLKKYYSTGMALKQGVPTVKYCGAELNMSHNYLSDLLK